MINHPKIVVIGGGTGNFTLLKGIKKFTPNITALVSMADDGGSTGVLRDELGVLPPGDVRQCLVALSEAPEELRELFNFRFDKGTLQGHSFGNIFLSAVEKMSGDFSQAIKVAGDILRVTGRVLPVSLQDYRLVMEYDGQQTVGEYAVSKVRLDIGSDGEKPNMWLTPKAELNSQARTAILQADLVVIAPGNLYASTVPALLVDGLAEALQQTAAEVAYVCNLVNHSHQTPNFSAADYVHEIERFTGAGIVDYVLYNTDTPDNDILRRYSVEGEYPVGVDQAELAKLNVKLVPGSFLSRAEHNRNSNDTRIRRSLIRHDSDKIAKTLIELLT